jgi:hypothetical protein
MPDRRNPGKAFGILHLLQDERIVFIAGSQERYRTSAIRVVTAA